MNRVIFLSQLSSAASDAATIEIEYDIHPGSYVSIEQRRFRRCNRQPPWLRATVLDVSIEQRRFRRCNVNMMRIKVVRGIESQLSSAASDAATG